MSEHTWALENLAGYVAGGMEGDEYDRFEKHVAQCGECARALDEAQALDRRLGSLFAPVRPSPALEDNMIQVLRMLPKRKSITLSSSRRVKIGIAVAAAVLLAFVGAGVSSMMEGNGLLFFSDRSYFGVLKTQSSNELKQTGLALWDASASMDPEAKERFQAYKEALNLARVEEAHKEEQDTRGKIGGENAGKGKLNVDIVGGTAYKTPLQDAESLAKDLHEKSVAHLKDGTSNTLGYYEAALAHSKAYDRTHTTITGGVVGGKPQLPAVPDGYVPVTVRVNMEASAAGFASLPSSNVDVISTVRRGTDQDSYAHVLLQDAKVLKVDEGKASNNQGMAMPGHTVTLAVKPQDAVKISLAKELGPLSLAMRKFNDLGAGESTKVNVQALLGQTHGEHKVTIAEGDKSRVVEFPGIVSGLTPSGSLTPMPSPGDPNGLKDPKDAAKGSGKAPMQTRGIGGYGLGGPGSGGFGAGAFGPGTSTANPKPGQDAKDLKGSSNETSDPNRGPGKEGWFSPDGRLQSSAKDKTVTVWSYVDQSQSKTSESGAKVGDKGNDKGEKAGKGGGSYFRPGEAFAQNKSKPDDEGRSKEDGKESPKAEPPQEKRDLDPAKAQGEPKKPDNGKQLPAAQQPQPEQVRKIIIRSGDIEFEIDNFDVAVATIIRLITQTKGGFVATINSEKLPNGKVRGSAVVRIPPEQLDKFLLDLRVDFGKMGELKMQRIGSQDVTKQYTDLESRLRAARTMEERLIRIIKDGKGEIKDLLLAEKELGVWRTKIEEIEGELRYYSNLASLSTLNIILTEKEIRSAAVVRESERIQAGIEVEDVEKALQDALVAIAEHKGRVTRSELKQHGAGQYNAVLNFETAPKDAGPLRDRLKQLGTMVRLEIDRVSQAQGGTLPKDGKIERGDTQFFISIYNLANVAPRETVTMRIAAQDVPAVYQALREAVGKAKGRVSNANINEQDKNNITAQLEFDIRRAEEAAILQALKKAGDTLTRLVTRVPEGDNVTDAKIHFRIEVADAESIP
ncbi:MAG: Flp pilus assembly protein CpaB, partial [Gemmataceae bacterium]|nr:Flp pilus assembly protein CpaB [Gemmataceae bacterium]